MDLVDSKYIGVVSSRLLKFKRVKGDLYNFRCPICGDSQKHKNKARGYLYNIKADINFRCHNCGASMTFSNFLKEIDPVIHKQYVFERFKSGHTGRGTVVEEPKFNFEAPTFNAKVLLPLCSEVRSAKRYLEDRGLDPTKFYYAEKFKEGYTGRNFVVEEPTFDFKKPIFKRRLDLPKASEVSVAKEYLEKRKIDPTKFYFASKFMEWVNIQKQTFDTIRRDESRIIIPMYDTERNLIGFQGRSLGPNSVKYITVMLDDDAPKIYGLDQIRGGDPVFVTEGPFDSTFIRNSIAMCGADADVSRWGISNPIWVYDNEPRNAEIVKRIQTAISSKQAVVIWPSNILQKDINDMVISGHDVQKIVEENIYSGLEATIKFNNWKKV